MNPLSPRQPLVFLLRASVLSHTQLRFCVLFATLFDAEAYLEEVREALREVTSELTQT